VLEEYVRALKKYVTVSCACVLVAFFVANFYPKKFVINRKVSFGIDFVDRKELKVRLDYDLFIENKLKDNAALIAEAFLKDNIKAIPKIHHDKIGIIYKKGENVGKIKELIGTVDANLYIKDDHENNNLIVWYTEKRLKKLNEQLLANTISIFTKRLSAENIEKFRIRPLGKDIQVMVAADEDFSKVKKLLADSGRLTFHFVIEDHEKGFDVVEIEDMTTGVKFPIDRNAVMDGKHVIGSKVTEYEGKPVVSFKLDSVGTRKFAGITKNNMGRVLALVLNDKIISAPRIGDEIANGEVFISGAFSTIEVNRINNMVNGGYLQTDIEIVEENDIKSSISEVTASNVVLLFTICVIMATAFVVIFFRNKVVASYALLFLSFVVAAIAMLNMTKTVLDLFGFFGIMIALCQTLYCIYLLNSEYIKENGSTDNKSKKYVLNNAFDRAEKNIDKVNFLGMVLFLLLYNIGNRDIGDMALVFFVGILSNVFVFKFGLKCFLERKL
jgi:protein-export membrane protein SecD